MREVPRKLVGKIVALDARVVQAEQVPGEAVQKEAAPFYLPGQGLRAARGVDAVKRQMVVIALRHDVVQPVWKSTSAPGAPEILH